MIDYYYFNEEWNKEQDVPKKHPTHLIGSLTQYEPMNDNTIGYTKRGSYDIYFHE